jgi:4-amino-4-deoxy-L-arabinose transferase-like glycosyltransferase
MDMPRSIVLLCWALALPLLLAGLGTPVVQRTQEARVLETAREMYDSRDRRDWMIPHLNGNVRLEKPPLAYWLAAASFKLLGVGEFAGRLPFVLAGWLTLGVVYALGASLIDRRFALLAAAILLTSFMFFRHFRLAETDSLAALFVTTAVWALWRGARAPAARAAVAWFHLAGLAIALTVLAKGPPAVFPILFFVAWVIVERNWTALGRFLVSGALLTAIVVGAPWFACVMKSPQAHVLKDELIVVTAGEEHRASFLQYFPQLLLATAPWTGVFVLGLVWSIAHWRSQPAMRAVLIWGGAILLPLFFAGNKQNHYLVPLTPALAMLGAYAVHVGLGEDPARRRALAWVMGATLACSILAPLGVWWAARHQRGFLQTLDLAMIVVVLTGALGAASLLKRQGLAAGTFAYAAAVALAFAVMFARWIPSLDRVNHRTIAADLRDSYGDGPYVFYAKDPSYPLVWNLRSIVPLARTQPELVRLLARNPDTAVIAQTKNRIDPPPVPASLEEQERFHVGSEGMAFRIYAIPR